MRHVVKVLGTVSLEKENKISGVFQNTRCRSADGQEKEARKQKKKELLKETSMDWRKAMISLTNVREGRTKKTKRTERNR